MGRFSNGAKDVGRRVFLLATKTPPVPSQKLILTSFWVMVLGEGVCVAGGIEARDRQVWSVMPCWDQKGGRRSRGIVVACTCFELEVAIDMEKE